MAVIGASSNPDKLGNAILANLIQGGFPGAIYPVNPRESEILGLPVIPDVSHLPDGIDLAVVVVPAGAVAGVLRAAASKGARAAIVISGGFREAGRTDLEDGLKAVAAETGLRIVGPNCQGINYLPNRLCASWPLLTARGPVAVISQSGTVAATLGGWASEEGFGVSALISLGNQIDVSESELLEFFAGDPNTRAIAMYLEGAHDGRQFLQTLQRVIPQKPVVVLKSGCTVHGQRAASSHTRSLAGRDEVFEGLCRQFGLYRAGSIESLYDSAKAMATLPACPGKRVMVVTSSGGSGILAVDQADRLGLEIPALPAAAAAELKTVDIPANATLSNPLDLTVATAVQYQNALDVLQKYDLADYFLLIFGDPIPGAAEAALRARDRGGAGIVAAYLGGGEVEKTERYKMHSLGIPVFPTPERAVQAIHAAEWSARFRRLHAEPPRDPSVF
ncbi:MAG TPA: CoA-binding protein, partial [Anaerolineaceae bacterium]